MLIPTLDEFLATCDSAFSFLEEHGFERMEPPIHRAQQRFQRWYAKGPLCLVVRGEGHGTMVLTGFETDGRRLGVIYLVPKAERPQQKRSQTQIEQILEAAHRVQEHCRDLLDGDLTRFHERSEPLPPYLSHPGS
jgi:hypothetical protein